MSDYKRFVSYIYEYKEGKKCENAGFVKVNARGGECKIQVHMKGFYVHEQKPYRVYVFLQGEEQLQGYLLGEIANQGGGLEWNCVTKTDSLLETGVSLEESKGLYIEGETQVWAAEWDDYPVEVGQFKSEERFARQKTNNPETVVSETILENKEQKASEAEEVQEAVKQSKEIAGFDMRKEQWAYLGRHFPVLQYRDNEVKLSGIRLEYKDLARLPRDKWELGNNSFLLHGFYQYHHLLLLRRQSETEVQYLIGVPGVYNEREQLMASMFGFEEFKVMKRPDVKNDSLGYWCRKLM